jgi:2-aminoadipate transaminase
VPNFQNPTGITYSLERRKQIIALAQEHGVPILEDDAYYDLRFEGERLPTFYELDGTGLVMYCGTFSKIMAAGMRLGWCVASPQVIAGLSGLKADSGTNPFASHVAAQFTASGTLQEHIAHLKPLYKGRRNAMLAALEQHMPPSTSWTVPTGGFFIWLTLPDGITCGDIAPIARERGVAIGLGSMFYIHGGGHDKVRLSYSFNDHETIEHGIRVLSEIVKEQVEARTGVAST